MELYDILTAAGAIAATYYVYRTSVPDEFKAKAARYTGLPKDDISEPGAMEVMLMRSGSRRANKDFFRRVKGLLTGRYRRQYHKNDSII